MARRKPPPAARFGTVAAAAEAALVLVSLATVASFARLFSDGSFFVRLAAFAVVSHAIAIATRRLRWSLAAAAVASLGGLLFVTAIALYPSTTVFGFPTGDTFDALGNDVSHLASQFQSVLAPTAVTSGFLLAAGLGLWWAAFVADWAAFRLWVPFESIVPASTVFVFASLFAAKQHQVASAAGFAAACLTFLLLHRVARQESSSAWMGGDVRRGTTALVALGAGFIVVTVVAAMIVGPELPQAHADAVVNWRNEHNGNGSRTTISPFVEIRKRLVDQSTTELFTVTSDRRAYWRLTSLDEFDGNVWSSNGSYDAAEGSLPTTLGANVDTTVVNQRFTISQLGTIWVPAAFQPKSVDAGNTTIRYASDSSTLIVGTDRASSDGLVYTVQSVAPDFDEAALRAAPATVPDSVRQHDEQLPAAFSPTAAALAQQIAGGQPTVYDKALALQDYFRNNFSYSLDVPDAVQGESVAAIDAFLESKSGYCEQFAGTYAAMARSLGIPARVAVGFTPGEQDPTQPGVYRVRGEHAHAWPEVYIDGQGWVLFEPTPTRGAPNAGYTHVPEEQSTGGGTTATTIVPTTEVPTSLADVPTTERPSTTTTTTLPATRGVFDGPAGKVLLGTGLVVLLAVLYCLTVPLVWLGYRARRRRAAADPRERVQVACTESTEATGVLGVGPSDTETPAEFAQRAGTVLEDGSFSALASLVEAAEYSRDGVADADADSAFALSAQVAVATRERTSVTDRVRWALDPRPPHRRLPRQRRARGPRARGRDDMPDIELL